RESVRQSLVVAADDDVHRWIVGQAFCGVANGDKFALAVTRRHEDHKALHLAVCYGFEIFVHHLQVAPMPVHSWRDLFKPFAEMFFLFRGESGGLSGGNPAFLAREGIGLSLVFSAAL